MKPYCFSAQSAPGIPEGFPVSAERVRTACVQGALAAADATGAA